MKNEFCKYSRLLINFNKIKKSHLSLKKKHETTFALEKRKKNKNDHFDDLWNKNENLKMIWKKKKTQKTKKISVTDVDKIKW